MSITDQQFADAQTAELHNWQRDAANASRLLGELTEHAEAADPLRRLARGRRFRRALEVGVGAFGLGFLAPHAWGMYDELVGLDPLPRLDLSAGDPDLQTYLDAVRSRVNYTQTAGEKMPFDDASFDLVACINVVDHAQDPEQIMREINRVLAPGGVFVFGVNTLSTLGQQKWNFGRRRHPKKFLYVAHPHTYRWTQADDMVRRTVPGKVLWMNRPSWKKQFAGHGRMSLWIIEKA